MNFLAFIPLETPRLILRRFEDRDLEPFLRYRNDPDVARYQGWDVPYLREKAEAMVKDMKNVPYGQPGVWVQLAMERKPFDAAEDDFKSAGTKTDGGAGHGPTIGDIAFVVLENEPLQAELGITLDSAYHSQGYAAEATRRLLDDLFGRLKLHRVRANIDPLNRPSARLLERLGFRHEGRTIESLTYKGRWADEDWYAILRREWMGKT